jgi:hypothetical protein
LLGEWSPIRHARDQEGVMAPIDYFMAIFVGMCIGLAGLAVIAS